MDGVNLPICVSEKLFLKSLRKWVHLADPGKGDAELWSEIFQQVEFRRNFVTVYR